MLTYFFIIEYSEQEIDDPEGVVLPSDDAAIEYARRIIDDIRKDRRPEDPEATRKTSIIVEFVKPDTDHTREDRE
jgi:Domain of unknown function (DUF6894)